MKQSKLKIAVTGGIGSGKSTVCKIINQMGYPVFSCDETYTELLNGGSLAQDLIKAFGSSVVDDNGNLNRRKLSEIVFDNDEKLNLLNSITHPKIFEKMFAKAQACEDELCFFEVPILFECGYENLFDKVIVVMREEEERIKAVMARDNLPKEKVLSRLNKQYNYKNSDFEQYYVIRNTGKINDLTVIIGDVLLKICDYHKQE